MEEPTPLTYPNTVDEECGATNVNFFCRTSELDDAHGITLDRVVRNNGNKYRAFASSRAVL